MSYAILRTAKLKTMGNIAASAVHNFREIKVPNADSNQIHLNRTYGAQSKNEVLEKVKARLATAPNIRKNSVLAIEYFIGVSPKDKAPEFHANPATIEAYFDKCEAWLKEKHGVENVVTVTRQYDETTPHICAYVVPIDKRGRLNASEFLDGRIKLSELQTDFAEKCGKPFGLMRGIEGSKAEHTKVMEFYARIQAPTPEITVDILPSTPTHDQFLAETAGVETEYNEARDKSLEELRAKAPFLKEIPLEDVLTRLGAIHEDKDRTVWETSKGSIIINEKNFFYLSEDSKDLKNGKGAIDLVMTYFDIKYGNAVSWLSNEFGEEQAISNVLAETKSKAEVLVKEKLSIDQTKDHGQDESNWDFVRNYLINTKKIDNEIVDFLHKKNRLYADKFKNVMFVSDINNGLILQKTNSSNFSRSIGKENLFTLKTNDESKKVFFVKNPIEALSLFSLGLKGRFISILGMSLDLIKNYADKFHKHNMEIIEAISNDEDGKKIANAISPCERFHPTGKNWNEDLCTQKLAQ